jgi:hypothetical protein
MTKRFEMVKTKTTEDLLLEQNEAVQARLDEIDAQLKMLFSYHGQNWASIRRQAAENAAAQGSRSAIPSEPTFRRED